MVKYPLWNVVGVSTINIQITENTAVYVGYPLRETEVYRGVR